MSHNMMPIFNVITNFSTQLLNLLFLSIYGPMRHIDLDATIRKVPALDMIHHR